MSDERIERALRAGPPEEPAYVPDLARRMATEIPAEQPGDAVFRGPLHARVGIAPRPGFRAFRLAGPIAAVIILAFVAVTARLALPPGGQPTPMPGDLLQRIRNAGSIRVAVTSGPPQTTAGGGAIIGFDVDVATELAGHLGVRDTLTALTPGEIAAGVGTWDVAFPSRAAASAGSGMTATTPYYSWPSWLAVLADSTTTVLDSDARVCVVTGSAAVDWFAGRADAGVRPIVRAPSATTIERGTDAACLASILAGDADAVVTAALLDFELAGRGMRVLGEGPVFYEDRAVIVRGSATDVASLVAGLDRTIADLRASGRLADLSRSSFGGLDITDVGP